jgi:TolB-like protein/class 3 adenylate cyclase/Flp pilus assembly protein TadD
VAEDKVMRKLTTILAADVEGYTRLMRADEEATLKTLGEYREIIDGLIARHEGRVFSTGGDSVLAEFGSAVEAVRCAISCQEEISSRNAELANDRKLMFRIGVNVGDVMVRDGDLFGDGVNVAARLEGLAEAGGVCISGSLFEQIKHKLSVGFEDMGPQEVKNLAEPVSTYRLVPGQVSVSAGAPVAAKPIGAGGWQTDEAEEEFSARALPDKPSIAVLPFDNMSGDPDQEFLADGLAEDIITALSKVSEIFVIARNSTFAYKGKSIDVRRVASELGVRTVLEGSVRRAGDRVRITAQLVDAESGRHLWADRFDRQIADIFELQDEITQEIVTELEVKLTRGEQVRLKRRQTNNLKAWDLYVRALACIIHFTREDNVMARELAQRAIDIDAKFAGPWVLLARTYLADARLGWGDSVAVSLVKGVEAADRSLAIDEDQADAYSMLGALHVIQRRYNEAVEAGSRSIEISPSAADNYVHYATTLNFVGRAEEAVDLIQKAMRLSPFYPDYYLGILGQSYRLLGRFEEAIVADKERLARNPENAFSDIRLAAVYSELGHDGEARFHVREALKKNPQYSLALMRDAEPYQDADDMEHYLELLRRAGLPE